MQVSETASGLHLYQIHIIEGYRNRKLGTHLIKALQDCACAKTQPITLNVIRGNPALALYRRLGFRVVGGDGEKLHMRWQGRRSS
jgi:ribosomal protein S18 acetylase RimI-like enzyme